MSTYDPSLIKKLQDPVYRSTKLGIEEDVDYIPDLVDDENWRLYKGIKEAENWMDPLEDIFVTILETESRSLIEGLNQLLVIFKDIRRTMEQIFQEAAMYLHIDEYLSYIHFF